MCLINGMEHENFEYYEIHFTKFQNFYQMMNEAHLNTVQ